MATGFISDNVLATGAMYIDCTNDTGSLASFQVDVRVVNAKPDVTPPVGAGTGVNATVCGDGISFDSVRQNLDLEANSGLTLAGVSPNKELKVKIYSI